MMKDWAKRAMQIACIEAEKEIKGMTSEEFLGKLHERERSLNYLIPNWNIQKLANLRTIKDYHGIPSNDPEAYPGHEERIERELIALGMKFERFTNEDIDLMDDVHAADWFVFRNREKIEWGYAGEVGKRGGILRRLGKD